MLIVVLAVHNIHHKDGPHCTAVFSLLNSPICTLQFADFGSRLAVGFECGRVRIICIVFYDSTFNLCWLLIGNFSLISFMDSHFSFILQVAVLDTSTLSVLFFTDCVSDSNSPVISLAVKTFSDTDSLINSPEDSESKTSNNLGKGLVFTMTRDAHFVVIDSVTGNIVTSQLMHPKTDSIAISMYIIGKYSQLRRKK